MPSVAFDPQRSRVRLNPLLEASARLAFGYVRNQFGLRDRRPLGPFLARNLEFFRLAGEVSTVEADMDGLSVLVSTSDRTIARSVYASGDWDPQLVGMVFEALRAYGRPWRDTAFLEIGANFGVYSLPAVASYGFARAIAYEPDPASFALLTENIKRNDLVARVTAHQAALSAAPGELTLHLGSFNAGDNRIVTSGAASTGDGLTVQVPARTFDGEVANGTIPLDDLGLVWLDVQGHEADVLEGAGSLLAAKVPLVVEYATAMTSSDHRRRLEDLLADCYDVMVDIGWCALTNNLRFQPASAIRRLADDGREVETDLLLLPAASRAG